MRGVASESRARRLNGEDAGESGQELVIGDYTPSPKNFDALVIGYYDGSIRTIR
jgi:hypothetical protein